MQLRGIVHEVIFKEENPTKKKIKNKEL